MVRPHSGLLQNPVRTLEHIGRASLVTDNKHGYMDFPYVGVCPSSAHWEEFLSVISFTVQCSNNPLVNDGEIQCRFTYKAGWSFLLPY